MKIIRPKGVLACVGTPIALLFCVGIFCLGIYIVSIGSYVIGIVSVAISCYAIATLVAEMIVHKIILEDTRISITKRRYFLWVVNPGKTLSFDKLQSLQVQVVFVPQSHTLAKVLFFFYENEKQNDFFDIAKFSNEQISQLMQDIQANAKKFCNRSVEILDEFNVTENKK
ncbi:MAG: hypothetical protein ACI4QL_05625 [Candidatus Fimimonas sp.]